MEPERDLGREMLDEFDGWCIECGDAFHLDDIGGYRPPCLGCGNCSSCCDCGTVDDEDDFGHDDEFHYLPAECYDDA